MSSSSNSTPSFRTIDLWAYMSCKDAHGPRVRRYIRARDEIVWGFFEVYEAKPTLPSDDKGVLVHVDIWDDVPKTGWKEAVRRRAFDRLEEVIQCELSKIDGVDKYVKKEL